MQYFTMFSKRTLLVRSSYSICDFKLLKNENWSWSTAQQGLWKKNLAQDACECEHFVPLPFQKYNCCVTLTEINDSTLRLLQSCWSHDNDFWVWRLNALLSDRYKCWNERWHNQHSWFYRTVASSMALTHLQQAQNLYVS